MAPKKQAAKAKTKAKAKPTPKATGKKRNPSPPVAPGPKAGVRVKIEPGTAPDPANAGSASSSSGGLGVDRGTISKLLTSLKYASKYQLKSQQNSEQQKADAQSVLNRYMDPQSTLEEKKHILQKLVTGGVRNCSWVHSMSVSTEAQEVESEKVMANVLTRRVRLSFLFFLSC